jgi:WD40 repeat protein
MPILLNTRVTDLQFSPSGNMLAIASWDGKVRFWDLNKGEVSLSLTHDSRIVQALRYSPDGTLLATAGSNGVILWDTASGQKLSSPIASSLANCIAFDPTGSRLLVGNDRERAAIMLVDMDTGDILAVFDHTVAPSQVGINGAYATGVAFGPNGRVFASSALDGTLRVWDGTSLELIVERQTNEPIYSIVFDPNGNTLLSYGTTKGPTLKLWPVFAPQPTAVAPGNWANVKKLRHP